MKKYSILMYNFNNYEIMREPEEIDTDCEYIYVTDNPNLKSDKWKIIVDKDLEGLSPFDKCYRVRFNLFKYASTPVCIYLDGSFQIHKSLRKLYDDFINSGSDLGLNIHPERDNVYDEYLVWVKYKNYPIEQVKKCLSLFNIMNYDPKSKGLYQGGLRICKNTELNKHIDNLTFDVMSKLGENGQIERLDQTIYSFIINHYFKNKLKIFTYSQQIIQSKYITFCFHNSNRPVPYNICNDKPQGYCQGNLVNLYRLV